MFNLRTKFSLILIAVLLGGIALATVALNRALNQLAAAEVTTQSDLLLQSMNSVRHYTSSNVRPLLADDLAESETFISETVPAFSARQVFDDFRAAGFDTYRYKEATLNPTNPLDQADPFETELVNQFRADPTLGELTGFRTVEGQELYYTARPLAVTSESCMECHNNPEVAPASLISTYGSEGGFGWEVGEIVAAQIIYVPAGSVAESAQSSLITVLGIVAGVFAASIILSNVLLSRAVIEPVGEVTDLAQLIARDELTDEDLHDSDLQKVMNRQDELGQLARVFQQMAHEVYEREERMRAQIQTLRIEIDEAKRNEQVQEVTETEYFQELQKRAREMRKRDKDDDETQNSS